MMKKQIYDDVPVYKIFQEGVVWNFAMLLVYKVNINK